MTYYLPLFRLTWQINLPPLIFRWYYWSIRLYPGRFYWSIRLYLGRYYWSIRLYPGRYYWSIRLYPGRYYWSIRLYLGRSYSCLLMKPGYWPEFKTELEANVGLNLPRVDAWYLEELSNKQNIFNTTIHEAVYYPPYCSNRLQAYLHVSFFMAYITLHTQNRD